MKKIVSYLITIKMTEAKKEQTKRLSNIKIIISKNIKITNNLMIPNKQQIH